MAGVTPTIILLIPTLMSLGCQTLRVTRGAEAVPEWVTNSPRMEGRLCAVGTSEPTFYPEDAKRYAAENARKELARALQVDIKSLMVDVMTGRGNDVDEATVIQVLSSATEAVLRESEVAEYWYDEEGINPFGRKRLTYALACMPRRAAEEVAPRLKTSQAGDGN